MDAVFIPADCEFEGEVRHLTARGDIQIEGNWVPRNLTSREGQIHLNGSQLELAHVAAQGGFHLKSDQATVSELTCTDAEIQCGTLMLGQAKLSGALSCQGAKLQIGALHASAATIEVAHLEGGRLEIDGALVLHGQVKLQEVIAQSLTIAGDFECPNVIVKEKVQVLSGRLAIRFLDCPQFDAERGVQGIVMVATGEILNAAGVRGFLRPQEIDLLSLGGSNDLGKSRANTADLAALENSKVGLQVEAAADKVAQEEAAKIDENYEVLDAQEADVWAESPPLREPLEPQEAEASATPTLSLDADPEEKDLNVWQDEQAEIAPATLDQAREIVLEVPESESEALTEPFEAANESEPLSEAFARANPEPAAANTAEMAVDLGEASLDDELNEALSLGPLETQETLDEEITTADLQPDLHETGSESWELGGSFEDLTVAGNQDLAFQTDADDVLNSADLTDINSQDLDEELTSIEADFPSEPEEPETEMLDPNELAHQFSNWNPPIDDVDISLSGSDFEAISHLAHDQIFEQPTKSSLLSGPEMDESIPTDHEATDLKGKLSEVLERICSFFPEDNYPKFITQIQHYVSDERFHILNKTRNREAVLASFYKLDHHEIANLALEFYAILDDYFGEQA